MATFSISVDIGTMPVAEVRELINLLKSKNVTVSLVNIHNQEQARRKDIINQLP